MKKSLILTSLLVGAISFSGCGSDNDGDGGGGGDNPTPGNNTNNGLSISPITNKNLCNPSKITYANISIDSEFATDGDIIVNCTEIGDNIFGVYQLSSTVQTLTVTNIKKEVNYDVDMDTAKGTNIDSYDYKAGTIHHVMNATLEGKAMHYDCTDTYPSPLPTTISDNSSIMELLDWDGDDNNLITSTCPESYHDDTDDDTQVKKGTLKFIKNFTITDSRGKKHLISNSGELIYK